MIIYWDTLEKNAGDPATIPDYINSGYFLRGFDLPQVPFDGWVVASETWIYASATTFTISGNKTAKYYKGMKIKLTQSSVKYFVIISASYSAPNTTITVHPYDSTTSLTEATITLPYYSTADQPSGFPYKPKMSAYLDTAQDNITNATHVLVNIDTEDYDVGSNFDTDTHIFTAPITGYYHVSGCVAFAVCVDQKYYVAEIYAGGQRNAQSLVHASCTSFISIPVSKTIYITRGDEVKLTCYHNVGANTPDLVASNNNTFLTIDFICL